MRILKIALLAVVFASAGYFAGNVSGVSYGIKKQKGVEKLARETEGWQMRALGACRHPEIIDRMCDAPKPE